MIIYHKHHIIPKHMGGTDNPSNIVELTIEEHAEAHKILWEQYKQEGDRIAWLALSGIINNEEVIHQTQILGGKKNKGRKHSKQARKNMSQGRLGMKLSEEHIKNVVEQTSKMWKITDPNGNIHIIKNKAAFCRNHKLTPNAMTIVSQGKQTHHKGYKCIKLS